MARSNKASMQYIVIGLGRFGCAISETLCRGGEEVLGVDRNMQRVEDMRDVLTQSVQLDAMDRDALEALGIPDFDIAFVTMGSDIRASGTIVMLLKELGAKRVIAKARDEFHGRMLEKLGADQVLFPERDMGRRIAHSLMSRNIIGSLELSPQFSMAEIHPLPAWAGKTLGELNLRSTMGVNVVAIHNGQTLNAMPNQNTTIQPEDRLLVVASDDTLRKLNH